MPHMYYMCESLKMADVRSMALNLSFNIIKKHSVYLINVENILLKVENNRKVDVVDELFKDF